MTRFRDGDFLKSLKWALKERKSKDQFKTMNFIEAFRKKS